MSNGNVQKITQYLAELSKLAPQFLKDHYGAKDIAFHKKEAEFAEYQNEEPFVIRNWRYDREHQLPHSSYFPTVPLRPAVFSPAAKHSVQHEFAQCL